MPRWVLPSVVLVLLLLAFAFRWEEGPKKTTGNTTIIYKYDRWIGGDWVKTYYFGNNFVNIHETATNIPFTRPVKPIDPREPKDFARFDFTKVKTEEESKTYEEMLAEYKIQYANYEKNVSNYIEGQYLIKDSLTAIWGIFIACTIAWLCFSLRKSTLKGGDPHVPT